MSRRRRALLPVVITSAVTALACGSSHSFDSATGCCIYYCNACTPSYRACPDSDPHAGQACDSPSYESRSQDEDGDGYTPEDGDCDETDPGVNPGATEACNGADDNCDGVVDEGVVVTQYPDADGDGHGDAKAAGVEQCPAPGFVSSADDCDDAAASTYPGATEGCDGADNDCDGVTDEGC